MTVGLPALALAVWARPGKTGRYLLPSAAPFVVPGALTIASVSLLLYHFYVADSDDVDKARTVLTMTSTICGVALIPFVQDLPASWGRLSGLYSDFRTTVLALLMLAAFLASLLVGPLRRFYELVYLPWEDYVLVALAVALWAVALSVIWRVTTELVTPQER